MFRLLILNFFILFISVSTAHAVETDQYMTWGITLPDSTHAVNSFLNQKIEKVILKINKDRKDLECKLVADKIFSELKGKVTFSQLSLWAAKAENVAKYPDPSKVSLRQFALQSIHRGMRFRNTFVKPARTININGIYFGVDKFGHFSYVGRKYYQLYLEALEENKSKDDAILEAIKYGAWNERYMLGYYISGVFSMADLEANYQGLLFGIDLCEGENSILTKSQEKFEMRRPVNIRDYINPYFDESYNSNIYYPHKFKQMKDDLMKYCKIRNESYVLDRFKTYESYRTVSFNNTFLKTYLSNESFYKRREEQSLNTICQ